MLRAEAWRQDCRNFAHFSASNHQEANPSIWNLSVYLEPASSKQYSFAQWTLEHFIRTKSTAWREDELVRVNAVIPSCGVCCPRTYECWSRMEASRWQVLWVMLDHPASRCSVLCNDYADVKYLYILYCEYMWETTFLVLYCISVLICGSWCHIRFQFAIIAEWHAFY